MVHVLVVEEARRARERLVRVLSDFGYVVASATDARTAVEHVRRSRTDVIVHGHVTPWTTEVLSVIRGGPELSGTALVLTFTRPELAAAADVCLNEGFTLDDLLAAVARSQERARGTARRASWRAGLCDGEAAPR